MTTLADKSLLSGGDNKPPMLEKHLYDSWKSRMELYMMNRPHGRMILASVEKGPLVWPSITVDGVTRLKEYTELTPAEAIQADCDIKAINIILQGLPTEICSWEIKLLFAADHFQRDLHSRSNCSNSRKQKDGLNCYNCKGEGHMSRQCTKPKRKRDDSWFKEKVLLLDAYDAIIKQTQLCQSYLMANLSHYGSDALAEVHNHDNMNNNAVNQAVQVMSSSQQSNVVNHSETEITSG
ncbi:retrovirus-related pol polyprotein from transposon TNT 1-94 [Tanacetum coccineum]